MLTLVASITILALPFVFAWLMLMHSFARFEPRITIHDAYLILLYSAGFIGSIVLNLFRWRIL